MRVFFTRRNVVVLVIALLVAAVAIVSMNTRGDPGIISTGATALTSPLKRAVASIAHTFESIYGYMYEYEQVVAENEALKRQIADLRQEYREYTEVTDENKRLYELLGLTARHSDWSTDAVSINGWSSSNWASSFTISKGSGNSKIKVGDAITTSTGVLIGRVTEVGAATSVCVSVIDTTFSAGAHVGELGATGIAVGDFALMREGNLKLTFLTDESTVMVGDAVVTSGSGGTLPNGLVIGTVTAVMRDASGISMYAVVAPATELRSAPYVYVVTDFVTVQ
ncbi:MAG: rod shape-determining protein MreC [Oscillospiraceae bacterium]|jgi:rod shape-determining protein MreC|nr:rod shape-determining protein MreC [Oscillospiraceae bacterium]